MHTSLCEIRNLVKHSLDFAGIMILTVKNDIKQTIENWQLSRYNLENEVSFLSKE